MCDQLESCFIIIARATRCGLVTCYKQILHALPAIGDSDEEGSQEANEVSTYHNPTLLLSSCHTGCTEVRSSTNHSVDHTSHHLHGCCSRYPTTSNYQESCSGDNRIVSEIGIERAVLISVVLLQDLHSLQ